MPFQKPLINPRENYNVPYLFARRSAGGRTDYNPGKAASHFCLGEGMGPHDWLVTSGSCSKQLIAEHELCPADRAAMVGAQGGLLAAATRMEWAILLFSGIRAAAAAFQVWQQIRDKNAAAKAFDRDTRKSPQAREAAQQLVTVAPQGVIKDLEARADKCWRLQRGIGWPLPSR
jgi:hypothetical protein